MIKSGRGGGGKHPLFTESLLEVLGIMRKHLSLPFSHLAMLQFSGFIEPEQAKHSKLLTPANLTKSFQLDLVEYGIFGKGSYSQI